MDIIFWIALAWFASIFAATLLTTAYGRVKLKNQVRKTVADEIGAAMARIGKLEEDMATLKRRALSETLAKATSFAPKTEAADKKQAAKQEERTNPVSPRVPVPLLKKHAMAAIGETENTDAPICKMPGGVSTADRGNEGGNLAVSKPPKAEDARPVGQKRRRPLAGASVGKTAGKTPPPVGETLREKWESFIGEKLLGYVGISVLVLGFAFLLAYSLHRMGPMGRAGTGVFLGIALLAAGWFLESKNRFALFGRILMAGGWSTLFFTAYGCHHIEAMRVIDSPVAGSAVLAAVSGMIIAHTLRYGSEPLTGIALLLAYLTLFVSEISLYTHVAALFLAILICVFTWKFKWHATQLAGIVLLYGGYAIWRYLYTHPENSSELAAGLALLGAFWVLFKSTDFSKPRLDRRDRIMVFIGGILNLFCLAISRKVLLIRFDAAGAPSAVIYLGIIYLVLGQILRNQGKTSVYRLDTTIGIVLAMPGLWCVLDRYSHCMLSWMILGCAVFFYCLYRKDVWFWDVAVTIVSLSALMILGGELPKKLIMDAYRLFSGEFLLGVETSLPDKQAVGPVASGVIGMLGAAALYLIGFFSFALEKNPVEFGTGGRPRDRFVTVCATAIMMIACYKVFPHYYATLSWMILGICLFIYCFFRRQNFMRMVSHAVIFLASLKAVMPVAANEYVVVVAGGWKTSAELFNLLLAMVYFHCQAFFSRVFLKLKEKGKVPSCEIGNSPSEENFLTSCGTVLLFFILWYTLPPIAVSIAYALSGIILLEAGLKWNRAYLNSQACVAMILSAFWLFTVNMGAGGEWNGLGRRLISSVPVLCLWAYAGYVWRTAVLERMPNLPQITTGFHLILSCMNFAAIMVLAYHHAYCNGLGWILFGLITAYVGLWGRHPIYVLQSLIATVTGILPIFVLATRNSGNLVDHIIANPVFVLCLPTLFYIFFSYKLFRRRYEKLFEQYEDRPVLQKLKNPHVIFGIVFCAAVTAILTALLPTPHYAIGWSALAFVLGCYGLADKERYFRWTALLLFAASVLKVIGYDIFSFATETKIVTLVGIGVALLAVSFCYNAFKTKMAGFLMNDLQ